MPPLRDFFTGRWRAVPVLGITQILAWGAIFYTPVLVVPVIAIERGWSIAFTMGGFPLACWRPGCRRRSSAAPSTAMAAM
jgi:hypothetical protein